MSIADTIATPVIVIWTPKNFALDNNRKYKTVLTPYSTVPIQNFDDENTPIIKLTLPT